MNDIKISVIIPTHKPIIHFITKTLEALSMQDCAEDYEVIVVENPSETSELKELVTSFGNNFRYMTSKLGSNQARDTGIMASKYEYIALLDDDCVPQHKWLSVLIYAHTLFPKAGIIGGPLELDFQCDRPKWLVNDFMPLLSAVDWENPNENEDGFYPFDIYNILHRYMVSANLSFTKTRYLEAGRLNTQIGLHGKDVYVSNDEIQFIEKAAILGQPRMLWVPLATMYHLIPEERCDIKFLANKSHGQGYGDGKMWIEDNPDFSLEDIYNNFVQPKMFTLMEFDNIVGAREQIADEPTTRLFIRNLSYVKTAYLCGVINALEGETWIRKQ